MAVYTHITREKLLDFLKEYNLGALKSFKGIQKGVSNTNYLLETSRGRYILTIFEEHRTHRTDLPFLFAYAGHLAAKGIACPHAFLNKSGSVIVELHGKPAAIIGFLEGEDIPRGQTQPEHCKEMGAFTARMHLAAADFSLDRDDNWKLKEFRELVDRYEEEIEGYQSGLADMIREETGWLEKNWPDNLPEGVIHADLFPDNIFFIDDKISAMIDMYYACTRPYIYDLAIVINSWCFDVDRAFQKERFENLIQAYDAVRPLTEIEKQSLNVNLRRVCLRFLVSRLEELITYDPEETDMVPHDPQEYIDKLKFHQENDIGAL